MTNTPKFRPASSQQGRDGFTIVELLIVIVVIAILAAITIVAYNGITRRTVEASMQTDLEQSIKLVENDNTLTGGYPATSTAINGGQGLKASGSNVLTYYAKSYGYCISVTNPSTPTIYAVRSKATTPTAGDCTDIPKVVTTLAGTGIGGFADGAGSSAQFWYPEQVAVDTGGNVYVADVTNNRIRKITPSGYVSTLAGSGTQGSTNGAGTVARFYQPRGVAVDAAGNVYVADSGNNSVRKITPTGDVSTLASVGGSPYGVAVDAAGNVYVAGWGDYLVRKVTPAGVVTILAGSTNGFANGNGAAAQFSRLSGIAVDASGTVYVADYYNNCIRKITPSGDVTTFAGSNTNVGAADGTGTAAQFSRPYSLTIDPYGTFYVGDTTYARIRMITSGGVVTTIAGSGTSGFADGVGTAAVFSNPYGIAADASGNVYVSDGANQRIRKISP